MLRGRCAEGLDLALQPIADALASIDPLDTDASTPTTDVAGLPWTSPPRPLASTDALRLDTFAALARILRPLATPAGLVVVVDDAHHADPVTIAWLDHLVRRRRELPMLVIATRPLTRRIDFPSTDVIDASIPST